MRKQEAEEDRGWGKDGGALAISPGPGMSPQLPKLVPGLTPLVTLFPASNIDNVVLDEDRSGARRLQNLWR
jgi:hypothetical protein